MYVKGIRKLTAYAYISQSCLIPLIKINKEKYNQMYEYHLFIIILVTHLLLYFTYTLIVIVKNFFASK
jgi:hypothetical protein